MYNYAAEVIRVVDGDTVDMNLDLGFGIHAHHRLRLHGINAPEPRGDTRASGLAATDHLTYLIDESSSIFVGTIKDRQGKYGRYLAVLVNQDGENLNAAMIRDGHAVAYQ